MSRAGAVSGRVAPALLAAATALAFSPALGAGYLGYDDDWLVEHNPVLGDPSVSTLAAIFTDVSFEGRLSLGGEYLPVRDVVVWLLRGVLDLPVEAMHAVQLGIYVAAALVFRGALVALFGPSRFVELAAALFALHPVHAESAVWLAGMKDVLALAFTGAALTAYARDDRGPWRVGLFTLLACFSKGVSVVAPLLFVSCDYVRARRPSWAALGAASVVAAGALAVHLHVGGVVGMIAEPIGGSRASAAASMLVVLFRYLGLSLFVHPHAVVYEVEPLSLSSPEVLVAGAGVAAIAALSVFAHRRGRRLPAFAWLVFVIGLSPVSQIAAPLQNHMADRYLMVAVLGPVLLLAWALDRLLARERLAKLRPAALSIVIVSVGVSAFSRARAYSDPVALFYEATERTSVSGVAPYQLAITLERKGDVRSAEVFYVEAYRRQGPRSQTGRRAGNNLGRLLYRTGRLREAEALFRELRAAHPDSPRLLFNSSRVLRALGEEEEADALLEELRRRFPAYERERRRPSYGPDPRGR